MLLVCNESVRTRQRWSDSIVPAASNLQRLILIVLSGLFCFGFFFQELCSALSLFALP